MWIKDGVIYNGGGIVIGGKRYWRPTDEQFEAAGWQRYTPPKRYSKRKIIDALGAEGWAIKKAELEAAGFYDKFVNSTYLCVDDPDFAAVYETLGDEERELLDTECLYDE
jgi:hypothetical protein